MMNLPAQSGTADEELFVAAESLALLRHISVKQAEVDRIYQTNTLTISCLLEQCGVPLRVVPFVGAGGSSAFGYRTWSGFLAAHASPPSASTSLEVAAEQLLNRIGSQAFHDAVEHEYGARGLVSDSYRSFVWLLPYLTDGFVITTNYDRVLEHVFLRSGRPFDHVVCGPNREMLDRAHQANKHYLFKIHGDCEQRQGRVLADREYDVAYGKNGSEGPVAATLRHIFATQCALFLGCSLRHDRTLSILHDVVSDSRMVHYAILQEPNGSEEKEEHARFLSERAIRPIWYPYGRHDLLIPLLARIISSSRQPNVVEFANAYVQTRTTDAFVSGEAFVASTPANHVIRTALADIYSDYGLEKAFENAHESTALLTRAVELAPTDPAHWARRGLVKLFIADYAAAAEDFTASWRISGRHQRATGMLIAVAELFTDAPLQNSIVLLEEARQEERLKSFAEFFLAASYVLDDRFDEARAILSGRPDRVSVMLRKVIENCPRFLRWSVRASAMGVLGAWLIVSRLGLFRLFVQTMVRLDTKAKPAAPRGT
jgi:tetratricopeptide (TPR) repeat protein